MNSVLDIEVKFELITAESSIKGFVHCLLERDAHIAFGVQQQL